MSDSISNMDFLAMETILLDSQAEPLLFLCEQIV